jgi:hypothetical protein
LKRYGKGIEMKPTRLCPWWPEILSDITDMKELPDCHDTCENRVSNENLGYFYCKVGAANGEDIFEIPEIGRFG